MKYCFTKKQTTRLQCYEAKSWTVKFNKFIPQMSATSTCKLFNHPAREGSSLPLEFRSLHFQFVDIIEMSVAGSCLLVAVGAVLVTLARLDHHHHPADDLAVSASEAHRWRLSPVRPAASPIWTGPTVPWLELFQATAAGVWQFNGMAGLFCVVAFLTALLKSRHQKHELTWV